MGDYWTCHDGITGADVGKGSFRYDYLGLGVGTVGSEIKFIKNLCLLCGAPRILLQKGRPTRSRMTIATGESLTRCGRAQIGLVEIGIPVLRNDGWLALFI